MVFSELKLVIIALSSGFINRFVYNCNGEFSCFVCLQKSLSGYDGES